MKLILIVLLAVVSSGCASLRAGWARVTWVSGGVSPEVACSARVNAEGDVEMVCIPLNEVQRDLLYRSEKKRTQGGEL